MSRYLCKLYLILLSLFILFIYFPLNRLFFIEIYYYEKELSTYAIKPDYLNIYCILFYFLPFFIFIFIHIYCNLIDNYDYYEQKIINLKKTNKFLTEENKFLKTKREMAFHLKMICVKYFIKNKENKCSICLDKVTKKSNVFLTFCGHLFHSNCIDESLKYSNKCPYCRRIIYNDDYSDEVVDSDDFLD